MPRCDPCDDGRVIGRVCVYFGATLSLVAAFMAVAACVAPIWLWDYDCDCIPWEGATYSPGEFNTSSTLAMSPWVAGISSDFQDILGRSDAVVDEDCRISSGRMWEGVLSWGEMDSLQVCVEGTPTYDAWGKRFCSHGVFRMPRELKLTKAFGYLTCIFVIITLFFGFATPTYGYTLGIVAAVFAFLSIIFSLTTFTYFNSWDYVQWLLNDPNAALPVYACDQPGMERQIIAINTKMQYGPTMFFFVGVCVLQFVAALIYLIAGRQFLDDGEQEED